MKCTLQLALAGMIVAISCGLALGAEQAAVITGKNVNVRSRPSLIGEVIGQLKEGESVTILEEVVDRSPPAGAPSKWARIKLPPGIAVWLFAEYVRPSDKTVAVSRLNLRAGPSESFGIVGRLDRGEAVQEVKTVEGWMEITAPAAAYAFVAADYLKPVTPTPSAPAEPTAPASPTVTGNTPSATPSVPVPTPAIVTPATGTSVATLPAVAASTPAPTTSGNAGTSPSVSLPGSSPAVSTPAPNTTASAAAETAVSQPASSQTPATGSTSAPAASSPAAAGSAGSAPSATPSEIPPANVSIPGTGSSSGTTAANATTTPSTTPTEAATQPAASGTSSTGTVASSPSPESSPSTTVSTPGVSTAAPSAGSTPATSVVSTPAVPTPTPAVAAVVGETANVAATVASPVATAGQAGVAAAVGTSSAAAGTAVSSVPRTVASTGTGTTPLSSSPGSSRSMIPLLAPPRASATPSTNEVRSTETNAAVAATTKPVVDETRPKRVVQREGIVGPAIGVQAPTYFELISPDSRKVIDFLYVSDPTLNLRPFWGQRIIVTGVEGLDPRWPKTPLLEVQSVEVRP